MVLSFNMLWLIDAFSKNFTIIRKFDNDITEYVYGSHRYFTDVWPPNLRHIGFPIRSAIRDDGEDVTKMVLKFAGPRKNFVHPLGASKIKKRVRISFRNFGIRFEIVDRLEKYHGPVTVTDIFGNIRTVCVE